MGYRRHKSPFYTYLIFDLNAPQDSSYQVLHPSKMGDLWFRPVDILLIIIFATFYEYNSSKF